MAKWGPLDQTIFYGTNRGRLIQADFETTKAIRTRDVHKNEIFSLTFSPDYTMLFTCSRDGTTKLLHPETFDEIRTFNGQSGSGIFLTLSSSLRAHSTFRVVRYRGMAPSFKLLWDMRPVCVPSCLGR